MPQHDGWRCPVCGRGCAPFVLYCPCVEPPFKLGVTVVGAVACDHEWLVENDGSAGETRRCMVCGLRLAGVSLPPTTVTMVDHLA
jgi:hypothetical protein